MSKEAKPIDQLIKRLNILEEKHATFSLEIEQLRREIRALVNEPSGKPVPLPNVPSEPEPPIVAARKTPQPVAHNISQKPKKAEPSKLKADFEKFIGENLISKIGILILILGVGIGAKYAIDNELISPLTRINLGYLVGLGLLATAFKLKEKYSKFSAVLLSGAMTILYFITFLAYATYELLPQPVTFALMVVFTIFTVLAAINYNRQIIAHLGLVGAYAVPFLLSTGEGNFVVLFMYMAVINGGVLFVAFQKYWKGLYYSSFSITWLIFFIWTAGNYTVDNLGTGLIFSTLFFVLFYLILMAYKILKSEKFQRFDIVLLLGNASIYYGFGYYFLSEHETGSQLLGVFTLFNAILHFGIGVLLYKRELADKQLFYFVVGLVLTFVTLAIPVQLDGNWVTLLWAGQAASLFWVGRTKRQSFYEQLSYALMALSFFSLLQDWDNHMVGFYLDESSEIAMPVFNLAFATSLLIAACFGFIYYINTQEKHKPHQESGINAWLKVVNYAIPSILLIIIYNTFRLELSNYWQERYLLSEIENHYNNDLLDIGNLWNMNYSMLFMAVLSFMNLKRFNHRILAAITLIISALIITGFLFTGLYLLSELRTSYLEQTLSEYYIISAMNIGIRYLSLLFLGVLLAISFLQVKRFFNKPLYTRILELFMTVSFLWILSSELLNLMDIFGYQETYRLALSILWGVFCVGLIIMGIAKKKRHLRLASITLFGITLLKLFFYDIAGLDTISKTIVFVSLGILLLVISFLYNKYKHLIFNESE
ncbi:DUF2339 domain-containing protein [Fulvivirga sp. M361]|uniref:DUF2339 domain-containing protein n=1 Tax=Fulvivirga sp. M361 TaxID=2594266 RepID=UPI00117B8A28|nr:DUF2339 domain-containing protein [Fulvivirga sp. M361]TRX51297.1 DUF2339 domain-containing protein [Fulvivirga sp. M361]